MKNTTWIVIANASGAKIYAKNKGNHHLDFIKELSHPDSRKKVRELISDGVGRYRVGHHGFGNFSSRTNPKRVEADHFAKELADVLEHSRKINDFSDLILAAPPAFQGLLKNHMSATSYAHMKQTIPKDYHEATNRELNELFR